MARPLALVGLSLVLIAAPGSARGDLGDNPYPCDFCLFEIRVTHGAGRILPSRHMNTFLDLSPDRGQVLFWDYHEHGARPFVGRETIVGKHARAIIDVDRTFVSWQRARWSPDGHRVAFPLAAAPPAACRGSAIWVVDVDGRNAHQVAGPCAVGGAWSPDSRRIAFFHHGVLSSVGVDGSGLRGLDTTPSVSDRIAWAPDGRSIAFEAGTERHPEIRIAAADGSGARGLVTGSGPSWGPDSHRLAFVRARPSGGLSVVRLSGGRARPVVGTGWSPHWSPDGHTIAYRARNQIFLVRPDGTHRRQLTHLKPGGDVDWLAWTRSSKRLLYGWEFTDVD